MPKIFKTNHKSNMNLKESINHFLPKIKLFSPKNEIDYYGFSYYLTKN